MSVTIVIPAYNAAGFVAEALASAVRQGSAVREIIVVDDHSADDTVAVAGRFGDPRIRLVANRSRGVSAARNTGAALATADWLMFLDADDRLRDGAVDRLLAAAAEAPQAGVVYGDYDRIDAGGRLVGRRRLLSGRSKPAGDVLERLLAGNFIVNGGIMLVRRAVFAGIGGFDETLRFCEDWHCWCRLAAVTPFHYLPAIVLDYRSHGGNTMSAALRSPDDFLPAADRVFGEPAVVGRLPAALKARLHRAAATHLITYAAAQAMRVGAYGKSLAFAARALRLSPSRLLPVSLRLVTARLGF
jgi:glycosyltransferase involved in cell wall biosynthesis